MSLAKVLLILFIISKNQLLVLLIFTVVLSYFFTYLCLDLLISFLLLIRFLCVCVCVVIVVVVIVLFPVVLGVKLGCLFDVFLVS